MVAINAPVAENGIYPRVQRVVIANASDGSLTDNPLGTRADDKSTATDTTAVSAMSVWKQISASVQSLVSGTSLATSGYSASATFTPAATSHTAGDCNGAAQTFALMGPSAGRIIITGASLLINSATAEATAWRLYLFNVTPPSAVADDGAFVLPSGDQASFLGYVDLGTAVDLVDTQFIQTSGINLPVKLAGTSLFGYLVNLTTLTPAAVAHIVTLHAIAV